MCHHFLYQIYIIFFQPYFLSTFLQRSGLLKFSQFLLQSSKIFLHFYTFLIVRCSEVEYSYADKAPSVYSTRGKITSLLELLWLHTRTLPTFLCNYSISSAHTLVYFLFFCVKPNGCMGSSCYLCVKYYDSLAQQWLVSAVCILLVYPLHRGWGIIPSPPLLYFYINSKHKSSFTLENSK